MSGQGNDEAEKIVFNEDGSVDVGKQHFATSQEAVEKTTKQNVDMRSEFDRRGNENTKLQGQVDLLQPIVDSIAEGDIKPKDTDDGKKDEDIKELFVEGDSKATTANIAEYVGSEVAAAVEKAEKPRAEKDAAKEKADNQKQANVWVGDAKTAIPALKDDAGLMKSVVKRAAITNWDQWFEQNPDLAKVCHNNPVRAAHLMLALEAKTAKDKAKASGFSEGGGGGGPSSETKMSEEAFRKLPADEQAKVIEKEMNERYEKRAAEKASG